MEGKDMNEILRLLAERLREMDVSRGSGDRTNQEQVSDPQNTEPLGEEEDDIDFAYFSRMRQQIDRENRSPPLGQGSDPMSERLFKKNRKALKEITEERSRQSNEEMRNAFAGRGYSLTKKKRMVRPQPQEVIQRTAQPLYPKRRRTLDQIRRDMLLRRRQRQPQQRRQYRGRSPSIRMSQKLVDRSRHILRNRRRDPEREERIRRIVKQKTDWSGLDHRKTYRPSAPFREREINQHMAKELVNRRRKQALEGKEIYFGPDPALRPTVSQIPIDMPHLEEMYEQEGTGTQFFPQQFTGYQNPFQPGPSGQGSGRSGQGSGRSGQSSTTETSTDMDDDEQESYFSVPQPSFYQTDYDEDDEDPFA